MSRLKTTFQFLLFFLAASQPVLGQWEKIHPKSPINQYFGAVLSPPNSSLLYAVGHDLAVSSDGGLTWNLQENFKLPPVTPSSAYWDVCFTSTTTAFLINENKIFKTEDTGESWETVLQLNPNNSKYSASAYFRSLTFVDEETGFAVGDFNKIFKTSDGGNNWTSLSWDSKTIPYRALTDVDFIDENIGFVSGYQSDDIVMNFGFTQFVMKTVDGGNNWQQIDIPTDWNYKEINIQFLNELGGFAHLTVSQEIDQTYYTLDGGLSWTKNSPDNLRYIHKAFWVNKNKGFLFGMDHQTRIILYKTENQGQDWQEIELPVFMYQDENIITDIIFSDENKGVAVGSGGSILSTGDGGDSWSSINKAYPYFLGFRFYKEQTAYASSGRGLFKTTDGGNTWQLVDGSVYLPIADFYLKDGNNGLFTGYRGTAFKMSEGTLSVVDLPVKFTYKGLMLEHQDSIIICGDAIQPSGKFLIKSGDHGETWKVITIDETGSILDFDQLGNSLYISHTNGISKSDDGGYSWTSVSTFNQDFLQNITFIDANRAVANFTVAKVCYTEDGGKSWKQLTRPFSEATEIYKFVAVSHSTVYACGAIHSGRTTYGRIWKSDDAGKTWMEEEIGDYISNGISDIQLVGDHLWASGGYGQFFRKSLSGKQSQWISFEALPAKTFGDAAFNLSATASSALPLKFTSKNTDVATVANNIVTIIGAGETIITASQAGNDIYGAAANVEQLLLVNKKSQTITFPALEEVPEGTESIALNASSDSGLPINYVSKNPAIATINGNTLIILSAGETMIEAYQAGNRNIAEASASRKLVVKPVTGTDEPAIEERIIYPNPADDRIIFKNTPALSESIITIRDPSGKQVFKTRCQDEPEGLTVLNIAHLAPGVYFLMLEGSEEGASKFVGRFVKY